MNWKRWRPNLICTTYIDGDVQSDYMDCPKGGRCVEDGKDCPHFMGIKTTEYPRDKGCCWLKVEATFNRFCFVPSRLSVAIFSPDVSVEEEITKFETFLNNKGWRKWVQIGRVDTERDLFDFKVNEMQLGVFNVLQIGYYFLNKGLQLDEERSQCSVVTLIKTEQLLKEV